MKNLAPLPLAGTAADTRACHGGNDYRGPGAWKRPRDTSKKRPRFPLSTMKNPLDLTTILMQGNCNYNRDSIEATRRNGKRSRHQGKNAGLASRLESLTLLRAPSHGVGSPGQCAAALRVGDNAHCFQRTRRENSPLNAQQCSNSVPSNTVGGSPERASESILRRKKQEAFPEEEATRSPAAPASGDFVVIVKQRERTSKEDTDLGGAPVQDFSNATGELRVPNASVKMTVDDKCNAQALDARTKLRVLLEKQEHLGKSMRQRRLEACLGISGGGGGGGGFGAREHQYPPGKHRTRKGRRNRQRKSEGPNDAKRHERRRRAHFHPLSFMTERDLQQLELQLMKLEDAEAAYLLQLEEARRRRQDYATYYSLALRYGPLLDTDFDMAVYPGKIYARKVSDAARVVQDWWWNAWPSVLRRRKSAALAIQSLYRGFAQRKLWHGIIRLRTLWGNTRITAHAFVPWRDHVAKVGRVAAFTRRFRKRCAGRCLTAWRGFVDAKIKDREDLVRRRLKRVKEGIRARVFEGWIRYSEISLAVERMRRRVCTRPVLRAWRKHAHADRVYTHLHWACATLASRVLRWRARARFVDCRRACCKIQRFARGGNARVKVQRRAAEARTRQAEEIVQIVEDERLGLLVEAEQARRDRLRAKLNEHMSHVQDNATAFLRTPAGKASVKGLLGATDSRQKTQKATGESRTNANFFGPQITTENEAREEVVRRFISQEKASLRHDFNAEWPPPLRCPRADCNATFVDSGHCARHSADAHADDAPGIGELGLSFSEPAGLAIFESYVSTLGENIVHPQGQGTEPPSLDNNDSNAVQRNLELWKAIGRWRAVPSCSPHYQRLTAAVYELLPAIPNKSTEESTGSERGRSPHLRELWNTMHGGRDVMNSGRWGGGASSTGVDNTKSIQRNTYEYSVDPLVLEQASWRALVDLHVVVGQAFLASTPYLQYLDNADKPFREAVAVTVANITARKRVEWLEEAQRLQAAAVHRKKEMDIDSMAKEALTLSLEGRGDTGMLGSLVDDQAVLLAVVILAERGAFAKVISAVWKEAVDEAARQHSREQRQVTPEVAEALSEAVYSISRSIVMDDLIDECATDLTQPGGDMWPDERATVAVADGVVYRVRGTIMTEIIDTLLAELSGSGEAEILMSEATRQTRDRDSRQGRQALVVVDEDTPPAEANLPKEGVHGETTSQREAGGSEENREDNLSSVESQNNHRVVLGDDGGTGFGTIEPPAKHHHHDGSNTNELQQAHETADGAGGSKSSSASASAGAAAVEFRPQENATPISLALVSTAEEAEPLQQANAPRSSPTPGTIGTNERQVVSDLAETGGAGVEATKTIMTSALEEKVAVMVQSALRRKAAYREAKALIARNFVKLFDPAVGIFYWYNQTTGESSWDKPPIIDLYFKKPAGAAATAIDHFANRLGGSTTPGEKRQA